MAVRNAAEWDVADKGANGGQAAT